MMNEQCGNDCDSCSETCGDRQAPADLKARLNGESHVGRVIGVISGKGGVGKSLVTSLLAVGLNRAGMRTAILDADITGPSIPHVFGISGKAMGDGTHILPGESRDGIRIMSINMLLENDSDPVIWRGPILGGTVKQFFSDVLWDNIDVMFVDLPPGTGDVPLTVFQSLPLDGVIVVTSPQELVGMIVGKAVKMARMMDVPILGLVENYAYFTCPDNGRQYSIFGKSKASEAARAYGLPLLGRLPVDPQISQACDSGKIEDLRDVWLTEAVDRIKNMGGTMQ